MSAEQKRGSTRSPGAVRQTTTAGRTLLMDLDWNCKAALVRHIGKVDGKGAHRGGFSIPLAQGSLLAVVRHYLGLADWARERSRLIVHGFRSIHGLEIGRLAERSDFPG